MLSSATIINAGRELGLPKEGFPGIPRELTMLLASEELEAHPEMVWRKVALRLNLTHEQSTPRLGNFTRIRVNSQENKGGTHAIPIEHYKPGLFAVSRYRPMLNETRAMLDDCWLDDCVAMSQATEHLYPACLEKIKSIKQAGKWKTFDQL